MEILVPKNLVMRKLRAVQAYSLFNRICTFSGDGSRISFDDTTGEISGGIDVLRGTDHSIDVLKGEGGMTFLFLMERLTMRWIS